MFLAYRTRFRVCIYSALYIHTSPFTCMQVHFKPKMQKSKQGIYFCVQFMPIPHLRTCVLQTQMVGKKTRLAVFPCSLCSTSLVRSAQVLDRCGASFPSLSVILTPGSTEQTEKADSGWHCTATSIAHHL